MQSDQQFHVKSEEVDQGDGMLRTRYFLYGQRDLLGGGLSGRTEGTMRNEDSTWGDVKSIYR